MSKFGAIIRPTADEMYNTENSNEQYGKTGVKSLRIDLSQSIDRNIVTSFLT